MGAASEVLSAKAKAMFGQRLQSEDYQAMMQKKSVAEVAAYLKQETYFSDVLEGINERAVHRGQLEALIRMDLFDRFSSLMRYVDRDRVPFYRYGIIDQEIRQLLVCIRSLLSQDKLSFIVNVPSHLSKQSTFKIEKLTKVSSYEEILEVVKGTIYESVLRRYQTATLDNFDFNSCESELRKVYLELVLSQIDQGFTGQQRNKVKDIFLSREELMNVQKIYRMKKYFNYGPEKIKRLIHSERAHLSKKEINDLIETVPADEFLIWLKKTNYRKYIDDSQFLYIEYHMKKILYVMDKQKMRFSTNPDLVVLAYMMISEMEIQNIVDIIEGVRYRIPSDKIARYLIY
ncbi:MAG: V-type ATPase subunit [Anaerorhabdus sp.]